MKYLFLIGVASLLLACSPQTKAKRNVFIVDVSDKDTPELDEVFAPGGLGYPDADIWEAHQTQYSVISNSQYPRTTYCSIEASNQFLSNEGDRKAEFDRYIQSIQSLKHGDTSEYQGSLIWNPLWHNLNELSKDSSMQTTVYLVSDLLENATWVSFYDKKVRSTLKSDPESIRVLFREQTSRLYYTNHLEVVLVHQPQESTEYNEFYGLIVNEIYEPILKEMNVKVSVRSKL